MTDVTELEDRIAAAMDRIARAVGGFDSGAAPREENEQALRALEAQIVQLKQALDAEQTASSQLRERVEAMKALKDKQQAQIAELEKANAAIAQTRDEDRAEVDTIIAALEDLVKEGPHA